MEFEFSAGVLVYTYDRGVRKYLVLKHADRLDAPKGHIEKGEKAEDAALRETMEEAGIEIKFDRYFRDEVEYWFEKGNEKIKKHVTFFLSKVPADIKIKISSEHMGYGWLTKEQIVRQTVFKDQKELMERADDYIDRLEKMEKLNKEYSELPKKHQNWGLSGTFVPGHGPLNAKIMFLGQAPGRTEDLQREPFVGMAGKLLDTLVHKAGLRRERVYITSIVQFFPPENRLPTEEEAMHCMPFLKRQIDIVRPKIIVALGNFSAENLVGVSRVAKNHGKIIRSKEFGCDVFITLHPAAAVRIKSNLPMMEEDFEKLKGIAKTL